MSNPINIDSGVSGMRKGLEGIEKAAGEIASADSLEDTSTSSLAESLVDLKASENQVDASAKVVKAVDEMIGTLLDTKA